jgi:hypothetical protein
MTHIQPLDPRIEYKPVRDKDGDGKKSRLR